MIEAIECDYLQFIGKTSHIFKCPNSDLFSGSHKHSIKIIISKHRSIHVWFGICYFLYLFHSRTQKYNKSLSLSHIYTLTITHFGFHKRKFIEHKSCEWIAACVKNVIKTTSMKLFCQSTTTFANDWIFRFCYIQFCHVYENNL